MRQAHSHLNPVLWKFSDMHALDKYNLIPHSATHENPARGGFRIWNPPKQVFPFGTIGTIPNPRPTQKLDDKCRPARFLVNIKNSTIFVLILDNYQAATALQAAFAPHHPELDRNTVLGNAFPNKYAATAPTAIMKAHLAAPITTPAARI